MNDYSSWSTNAPWYSSRSSVTSISIGSNVSSIGNYAFKGCSNLTSITIPSSITTIGYCAFDGCSSLKSVTIGTGVTSIGYDAFGDCSSITSVTWNAKNGSVDDISPFNDAKTGITSFKFGSSVQSIPAYLCDGLSHLTSITIPTSVTSIGNGAFHGCSGLTSVTISSNVTSIGDGAFYGCSNLTSVTWNAKNPTNVDTYLFYDARASITSFSFGSSVQSIPAALCYGMRNLTSITIPLSVTSIGYDAFDGCSGITSVTWNAKNFINDNGNNPFYAACDNITSFKFGSSVQSIPAYLCYGMSNLTSITIPSSVTSIGNDAFDGCSGLKSISFPTSVTSIGEGAFYGCSGLTSITISNYVTDIGDYAFEGCSGLKSVTIGSNLTHLGSMVFDDCDSIKSVIWNAKNFVDDNGYSPFEDSRASITSFTFGSNVQSIPAYVCEGMSRLTSITIPSSVTSIGKYAFYECSSLQAISIPYQVSNIGDCAFRRCSSLASIVVASNNTVYDSRNNCNAIIEKSTNTLIAGCKNSIIPANITSVGKYAFYGCTGLSSITFPSDMTGIGDAAFSGCSGLTSISIPSAVSNIGTSAFSSCSGLTSITVSSDNLIYDSRNNCNAIIKTSTNTLIAGCKESVIPNSVECIEKHAFSNCQELTSIVFPYSVTRISEYAFYNCSGLTSLTIPASITSIGEYAFGSCSGLKTIKFYNPTPPTIQSVHCFFSTTCKFLVPCGCKEVYVNALNEKTSYYKIDSLRVLEGINLEYEYSVISENTDFGSAVIESEPTCTDLSLAICAEANYGYLFSHWSDGCTDSHRTLTLSKDTSLVAYFEKCSYTITIDSSNEHGIVQYPHSASYLDTIILTAVPDDHYHFVQWNDSNISNPRSIIVERDTVFAAVFEIDKHTITVIASHGHVEGGGVYPYGEIVNLHAYPDEGYKFDHWSDGSSYNPTVVPVLKDTQIEAFFAPVSEDLESAHAHSFTAYTIGQTLCLDNADAPYTVVNANGSTVYSGSESSVSLPAQGMYVVICNGDAIKIITK